MSEPQSEVSALHENIARKGSNSYYYAHGNTATGPTWDGKEEPRLISTGNSEKSSKPLAKEFDSFSWLDEQKSVKIYIDFDNANEVDDEKISLMTEGFSFEFSVVSADGKMYSLNLSPLNDGIASATYRKKTDKFVLTLKKATEGSWMKLKK